PHGEFGRDLDVNEPRDSAGPEQVSLTAGFPDHARIHEGAGFDGLERIDLHAGRDVSLLLDDTLVADDGALLDSRAAHDVGVLAADAATQVHLRSDEHVVVHHGPMQERAALHDDIAAKNRVLAQLRAGFDLCVVADVQRPFQDRVGIDLGALADPDTRHHLEALDLDVDLAVQYVGLHLDKAFKRADVLPVRVGNV